MQTKEIVELQAKQKDIGMVSVVRKLGWWHTSRRASNRCLTYLKWNGRLSRTLKLWKYTIKRLEGWVGFAQFLRQTEGVRGKYALRTNTI